MEAWDRGEAWQHAITSSLRTFDQESFKPIADAFPASIRHFESKPENYGL